MRVWCQKTVSFTADNWNQIADNRCHAQQRLPFGGIKGALRIPLHSFQLLRRPSCAAKLLCFHIAGGFESHPLRQLFFQPPTEFPKGSFQKHRGRLAPLCRLRTWTSECWFGFAASPCTRWLRGWQSLRQGGLRLPVPGPSRAAALHRGNLACRPIRSRIPKGSILIPVRKDVDGLSPTKTIGKLETAGRSPNEGN